MSVEVLIPTYHRPSARAVTLTSLAGQTHRDITVIVSDQTEDADAVAVPEVAAVLRVLQAREVGVPTLKHLPRRGLGEHRQFLLDNARAPFALFLDDDLILAPDTLARLVAVLDREQCGFAGCSAIDVGSLDPPPGEGIKLEF